jgi:hypothetical protein
MRWAKNRETIHLTTIQKLTKDQPGLDRLSDTHVVCDQKLISLL